MNAHLPVVAVPRRRVPLWVWFAGAFLLALLAAGAGLFAWFADVGGMPVHVVIDGEDVTAFDPQVLDTLHHPALAIAGVLLALLVAAIVVPAALAIAFIGLAIGLGLGVGVPLLVVALIAGVLLAPLWLPIALGVWLWRRASPPARVPAANIAP